MCDFFTSTNPSVPIPLVHLPSKLCPKHQHVFFFPVFFPPPISIDTLFAAFHQVLHGSKLPSLLQTLANWKFNRLTTLAKQHQSKCLPPESSAALSPLRRDRSVNIRKQSISLRYPPSDTDNCSSTCPALQGHRSWCRRWHRTASLPSSQAQPQGH